MKFRKKPVVIDAVQYSHNTYAECAAFCPTLTFPDGVNGIIPTLEGDMKVSPGDWIIKGVNGEFYPCKPDIFEKTYIPA